MGLLNYLVKKFRRRQPVKSSLMPLNMFAPQFNTDPNPMNNDLFVSCIQAHASHGAKISPVVYFKEAKATNKQYLTDLLSDRPNTIMSAPVFWEKVTSNYYEVNNVFIYIDIDETDLKTPIKGLYVIDPELNQIELKRTESNELYIKFILDGLQHVVPLEQIIHIARNAGDFFGRSNKAIERVLKVISTNYDGIEQAIKTSAFLRFIVQITTPMTEEILEEKAKQFASQYLGQNATGIAYIDAASNIIRVDSQARYANADDMQMFERKIYNYLRINEKILQGTYNEEVGEWTAYYESAIEPLVLKIEKELTYKLLTSDERKRGYKINVDVDKLQHASLKTRVAIAGVIQKLPTYVPNVVNKLLYLPTSPHGDEEFSTLNYVKADQQSEYQGG
jgi:HK97 family phage portal protein